MKDLRFVTLNLTTLLGIFMGVAAMGLIVFFDAFGIAVLLIVGSAIIDRYDGRVARRYNLESLLGEKLDLTNDFVTFGVAPMVLLAQGFFQSGILLAGAMTIYLLAGVYRLRRFHQSGTKTITTGVPITPIGAWLAFTLWIAGMFVAPGVATDLALFGFILLLSLLMATPFQVKKI